jgi:CBS domain-containing protein
MVHVHQLLEKKGREVFSIGPDASVLEAIKLMADKGVGALLVLSGDELVGIVSERDYARKVVLKGRSSQETPVNDIMTTKVLFVTEDHTLDQCMAIMTSKRIRHLPVMKESKLVGVFSSGDVIKEINSEQEFVIDQLENYIKGR